MLVGVVCLRARPHKHTGPSYKPYCMPSLTVALLLLEWLHDGVYAGRCWEVSVNVDVSIGKSTCTRRSYLTNILH